MMMVTESVTANSRKQPAFDSAHHQNGGEKRTRVTMLIESTVGPISAAPVNAACRGAHSGFAITVRIKDYDRVMDQRMRGRARWARLSMLNPNRYIAPQVPKFRNSHAEHHADAKHDDPRAALKS